MVKEEDGVSPPPEDPGEEGNGAGGGTPPSPARSAFAGRKLLLSGLICLAAVLGSVGYMTLIRHRGAGPGIQPAGPEAVPEEIREPPHGTLKQDLQPFFIPLPPEARGEMARFSFSVTLDRTSSKRFHRRETMIRDRIYLSISELAARGKGVRDMSPAARLEVQRILGEFLEPEPLRVEVEDILIF
jgi:hypothetical protein